jgi:hypothetical protein
LVSKTQNMLRRYGYYGIADLNLNFMLPREADVAPPQFGGLLPLTGPSRVMSAVLPKVNTQRVPTNVR